MANNEKGSAIMKTPIKKAAAPTAAIQNKQRNQAYPKAVPLSSLKIKIGELLLLLLGGHTEPDGWRQFEQLLRQFYDGGVL